MRFLLTLLTLGLLVLTGLAAVLVPSDPGSFRLARSAPAAGIAIAAAPPGAGPGAPPTPAAAAHGAGKWRCRSGWCSMSAMGVSAPMCQAVPGPTPMPASQFVMTRGLLLARRPG